MASSADATFTKVQGENAAYPVAAATTLYKGSMIMLDDGYAKALTDGGRFVGHCIEKVTNTTAAGYGTAGDLNVTVLSGVYRLKISLTGVNAYMNGAYVYAYDDNTYTLVPLATPVGRVVQYESAGVAVVEFDTNLCREKMVGLGIFEPFRTATILDGTWTRTSVNGPGAVTTVLANASREGFNYHTGVIMTTDTAEDDGESFQLLGEPFYLDATTKPFFFGCKVMLSEATQSDLLVGACITDTALLGGMTDGINFRKVDGSTDTKLYVEKGSTETASASSEHTMVAATAVSLGFVYDGVAVYPYVNGTRGTGLAVTNLPDDEALTPSIELLAGTTSAVSATVYFMDAYQIVG